MKSIVDVVKIALKCTLSENSVRSPIEYSILLLFSGHASHSRRTKVVYVGYFLVARWCSDVDQALLAARGCKLYFRGKFSIPSNYTLE